MTVRGVAGVAPSTILAYAAPALVVALPTIPVSIHLPTLYGVDMGVGLAATGLILLAARLFDALTDPLIGALSDRYGLRGSRRKPWIAAGALIAGLGLVKLLDPPVGAGGAYLLVWSSVLYLGWTMVSVPYNAWGSELSADYDERTRITSWREGLALCGIVAAGALNAGTAALGWSDRESIASLAWFAVLAGVVVFALLLLRVPDRSSGNGSPARSDRDAKAGFVGWLALLAGNRPFTRLLAAWFLNGLANGIPAALFFLYLEHGLSAGAPSRPMFILVYFLAAIAGIPLWLMLSRRFGKHRVWCAAMMAACAAFAVVPLIPPGGYAAFGVVCLITGMALGADLALPPAMQADVVDYDALLSGRPRAGLQFALWGMSTKLALAVSVGIALPVLEALGFDPAAPNEPGVAALVVIYALVPVAFKLVAIALVWGFPLNARKQATIRRRLRRGVRGAVTLHANRAPGS